MHFHRPCCIDALPIFAQAPTKLAPLISFNYSTASRFDVARYHNDSLKDISEKNGDN